VGLMGYIKDGKYVTVTGDDPTFQVQANNPQFKAGDHDRQRKDFAKEIIQPYNKDGSINEDFINAYPDESRDRGFIPKEIE